MSPNTCHQAWKPHLPISQISLRYLSHSGLYFIGHIIPVVMFVPERTKQICEASAVVLALPTEGIDEFWVEAGEKV